MTDRSNTKDEELVRTIGTQALGLSVVNMVVGGGIFVLPGLIAVHLGSAAIIAYFLCALAVALVFLCFAEIGTRITRSGGAYAYVEEAFGPFAGFVCSILFWFGWSALSDAAITVAMVNTIEIAFPQLGQPVLRSVVIVALVTFLAIVNIRGVKSGVRLFVINTFLKLLRWYYFLSSTLHNRLRLLENPRTAIRGEYRCGCDHLVLCFCWGRVGFECQWGNQEPY